MLTSKQWLNQRRTFLSRSWACHQGSLPEFLMSGQLCQKPSLGLLCLALGKQLTPIFICSFIYLNVDLKSDTVSRSLVTLYGPSARCRFVASCQEELSGLPEQPSPSKLTRTSSEGRVSVQMLQKAGFVHLAAIPFPQLRSAAVPGVWWLYFLVVLSYFSRFII